MGCLCSKASGVYFQGVPAESYYNTKLSKPLAETRELLNLEEQDAIMIFLEFCAMDEDESGELSLAEFYKYQGIKKTRFFDNVFTLLDKDESGELDFNEFLVGIWNFLTFDTDHLTKFAFGMYDLDGNGKLSMLECKSLIRMIWGSDKAEKKLAKHLEAADTDHDGEFTPEEFVALNKKHPQILAPALDVQDRLRKGIIGRAFWKSKTSWRNKTYEKYETIDSILLTKERERRKTAEEREAEASKSAEQAEEERLAKVREEEERRRREEDEQWDTLLPEHREAITLKRKVWEVRKQADATYDELREHRELSDNKDVLGEAKLMWALRQVEITIDELLPILKVAFESRLEKGVSEARFGTLEELDKYFKSRAGKTFIKAQIADKKASAVDYPEKELTKAFVKQEYTQMKVDVAVQAVTTELTDEYEKDLKEYSEMREDLLLDYGVDDTRMDNEVWDRIWSDEYQRYYFHCPASDVTVWDVPEEGQEDPDFASLKHLRKWGAVDDIYAQKAKDLRDLDSHDGSTSGVTDDDDGSAGGDTERSAKSGKSKKKKKKKKIAQVEPIGGAGAG